MPRQYALGLIGAGSMGSALARGLVRRGALQPAQLIVSDADRARARALASELNLRQGAHNAEVAAACRFLLLAVKPPDVEPVLQEIAASLGDDQTVVSIAAGVPLSRLQRALGRAPAALVRVMPNMPALVGAGAFALAAPGLPEERVRELTAMLEALGDVVLIDEHLMDAVTGLSGSGPAFVFLMIEALADGGVAAGLPRPVAQRLAVQTVLGAALAVRETGQHPGALKDAVASPGGTTIAGLAELERAGFRSALISAVRAAAARAREISQGG